MESRTDRSYGIVPVRIKNGNIEVFLINQYSRIGDNTYWVFPKGHAEAGESPLQAAERELREETGMRARTIIDAPTFSLEYRFSIDDTVVEKTVEFFIGLIGEDQTPVLDPEEVRKAGWFTLAAARERLDYEDTKRLFDEVRTYLEGRSESL